MSPLVDHVAHRLSGLLHETWAPEQVQSLAEAACAAVEEWYDDLLKTVLAMPARRDHTVVEARAYRDGVEDVTTIAEEWERFWGER